MPLMRAAVLSTPGTIEVVTMEQPTVMSGQVLIRVAANAICGSDLKAYRGYYDRCSYPTVLGHELAGTVVDERIEDDESLLGATVCVEPIMRCGTCRYCQAGLTNLCPDYHLLGESLTHQGGCAEYIAIESQYLHRVPSTVSARAASLVQPLAIAYEGVVERGKSAPGESVLVIGAGPIGLGAMLLAKLQGARVMITDLVDHRLDKAAELGADMTLRSDLRDLEDAVMYWTDGRGVDLSVEAVGGTQTTTLGDAQRATAARGRIVVLGGFSADTVPFPIAKLKRKEQVLLGSQGHPGTFPPVIELIATGALAPEELISHVVGLEDLPVAFEHLDNQSDGVIKIVVEP